MTSLVKKFAVLILVVSVTALAGCASIGSTGGSDTSIMDDLLTERTITRAIYAEQSLADDPILVGCVDGVVTLTGSVDNAVDIQLAERLARNVSGVTEVVNNLTTRT